MYRNDKITHCEEINEAGVIHPVNAFYLFLSPKGSEMKVAILTGRLINNDKDTKIPVVPNEWNPMVFREVEITPDVLANYNVFIGTE